MILQGFQLHQKVKDLTGEIMTKQIMPTKAEIEEAQKAGKTELEVKITDLTVGMAIFDAATTPLGQRTPQGVIPDPHEDKTFRLYEIARMVKGIGNNDEEIELDENDCLMLKERLRKTLSVQAYGFVHEILSGKNTEMKVVKPRKAHGK